MMKRNLSILLVLVMLLSLMAGCSGKQDEPNNANVSNNVPETTAAPAEEERPLALGVVDGNTYTNTYAGLGITLDSGWSIQTADELQTLPETVKESMEGTALGDAMKDVQQFTDMFAENVDDLTNMNILFQKQSMQERIAFKLLSEEEIIDETLNQKDSMIEAYAAAGINVTSMEKVTVTFLGEEHFALKTVADTQGVPYYMLQVFDYHLGEYSIVITLASFLEDNTEPMLDLFYVVE